MDEFIIARNRLNRTICNSVFASKHLLHCAKTIKLSPFTSIFMLITFNCSDLYTEPFAVVKYVLFESIATLFRR